MVKDIFLYWNINNIVYLIWSGLVDNDRSQEALNLFKESNIEANEYTYSILFKLCAKIANEDSLEFGQLIFSRMSKKFHKNRVVRNSALHVFITADDLKSAEAVFDPMDRNITCYGSMMKVYNIKNQPEKTIELYQKMKEIVCTLLIDACSEIGDLELSQSLIREIPENFLLNLWVQTGLIDLWINLLLTSID